MKTLDVIVAILLIIGGLNWGLVGVFKFDLVAAIFGDMGVITRIIYIIVGVCAIYQAILWKSIQNRRGKSPSAPHPET
jgi:uncharacterized membrane protein YuzA (DUF378 family)